MGRGLTPLLSITGFERAEPFGFERAKPFGFERAEPFGFERAKPFLSLGGKTP